MIIKKAEEMEKREWTMRSKIIEVIHEYEDVHSCGLALKIAKDDNVLMMEYKNTRLRVIDMDMMTLRVMFVNIMTDLLEIGSEGGTGYMYTPDADTITIKVHDKGKEVLKIQYNFSETMGVCDVTRMFYEETSKTLPRIMMETVMFASMME